MCDFDTVNRLMQREIMLSKFWHLYYPLNKSEDGILAYLPGGNDRESRYHIRSRSKSKKHMLGFDNNTTGTWKASLAVAEERNIPLVCADLCELDNYAEPNSVNAINADLCTFYSHKFVTDFLKMMRSVALRNTVVLGVNLQQRCSPIMKKDWDSGTIKHLLTKWLNEEGWVVERTVPSYTYRSDLKSNMEYNAFLITRRSP